jgi:hypothetical protein
MKEKNLIDSIYGGSKIFTSELVITKTKRNHEK